MHAACHKPETYWVGRLPFILLLHKLNPKLAVSRKTCDREHERRSTCNILKPLKPRLSKSPTAGSKVKVSCSQPCWIWCFLSLLSFLLGNYLEVAPGLSTVHRLFAWKQRQDHKINKQTSQGRARDTASSKGKFSSLISAGGWSTPVLCPLGWQATFPQGWVLAPALGD